MRVCGTRFDSRPDLGWLCSKVFHSTFIDLFQFHPVPTYSTIVTIFLAIGMPLASAQYCSVLQWRWTVRRIVRINEDYQAAVLAGISVQVRQHLADDAVLVLLPLVEDEEVRLPERRAAVLFLYFVQLCSIYFSIDWDKSLIVGMSWCTAMDSIGCIFSMIFVIFWDCWSTGVVGVVVLTTHMGKHKL